MFGGVDIGTFTFHQHGDRHGYCLVARRHAAVK